MKIEDLKSQINKSLESGEQISPTLFLWNDLIKNNITVSNLILELFQEYSVDKNNLIQISDSWEGIKIEETRLLLEKSSIKANDKFQVFLIENISRLSISSWNSLLKFLEEPWIWNIIFLTNTSESWVLDTILSRCKKVNLWWSTKTSENNFYYNLLDEFVKMKSPNIFSYFYKTKLEKKEYITFLKEIINYSKQNLVFSDFLNNIEDDLNLINNNNLNPKNITLKYLIKIKNYET